MISDEQVQIALKVWHQDADYEPSASAMRDMRAALEMTVDGPPPPPGTDEHGWHVSNWTRQSRHGTFFIGRLVALGRFSASRVHPDASKGNGLDCYAIGGEHASLEAAKAAVAKHIVELDAQVATPVQVSEQLEACR